MKAFSVAVHSIEAGSVPPRADILAAVDAD